MPAVLKHLKTRFALVFKISSFLETNSTISHDFWAKAPFRKICGIDAAQDL